MHVFSRAGEPIICETMWNCDKSFWDLYLSDEVRKKNKEEEKNKFYLQFVQHLVWTNYKNYSAQAKHKAWEVTPHIQMLKSIIKDNSKVFKTFLIL